jgi:hypothetical protein
MEPGDLGLEQSFRDAPTLRHPQVSCNVKQACDVIFGASEVDQTSRSRLVMARCFGLVTLGFRIYRMAIAVCVVAVYPHCVVASLTLELRKYTRTVVPECTRKISSAYLWWFRLGPIVQ